MNCLRRKCRQTDGDIFRAVWHWRAVLNPFTCSCKHGLAGVHIEPAIRICDAQGSLEDKGELVKFRRLAWLYPSTRAAHVSHAEAGFASVHASNVFIDQFRFVFGSSGAGRVGNKNWHSRFEDSVRITLNV